LAVAHILIVDDYPPNLLLLGAQLESEGHTTVAITDGHSAVDRALAEPFDLIVLDVLMPGLDGIETCALMRAQLRQRVPVLFLTAVTDAATRIRALQAGGDAFVTKPVDRAELLGRVRELLTPAEA
jgi:two-component system cell cycle response regulator